MLDNAGNKEWEKNFGGSQFDLAVGILQNSDNEIIVANTSSSDDGDLTDNKGGSDFWVMKLDATTSSIKTDDLNSEVSISPNPSNGEFVIDVNNTNKAVSIKIINAMGHTISAEKEINGPLSISNLPKGNYYIQIVCDEFSTTRKLIVL